MILLPLYAFVIFFSLLCSSVTMRMIMNVFCVFSGFFCFFLIWNWCLVWHFCQIGLASYWSFTTYRFIFVFVFFSLLFWLIFSQMLLPKQVKNAIFCQELLPKCALTEKRSYESFCNLPTRKMSLTMNVLQQ